jgi:hypothetical protein
MWCIGAINGEYLARMEDLLSLYHLAYNARRPLICVDELPFQLLGEKVEPIKIKPGAVKKFDYEYERRGTASVFVAFEPLTGKRLVRVYRQRTKADYCRFAQEVARKWGEAEMIVLVQDNLNTHSAGSFYENLPAAQAAALMKRFEMQRRAEKRLLAEHGGVGAVGDFASMLIKANPRHRDFEPRDRIDCQRTKQT